MYGKRIGEYLAFQRWVLAAMLVVGLTRLGLSLAGAPRGLVVWFSLNLVGWTGAFWYGAAAWRRGFGGYKHLLPLAFFQTLLFHAIAVLGILLTIAGMPNVYAAPEFSGPAAQNQWLHAGAHLTIGMVAATLLTWGGACLSMRIAKAVAPRPATAVAA